MNTEFTIAPTAGAVGVFHSSTLFDDRNENYSVDGGRQHSIFATAETRSYTDRPPDAPFITILPSTDYSLYRWMRDVLSGGEILNGYVGFLDTDLLAIVREADSITIADVEDFCDGPVGICIRVTHSRCNLLMLLDDKIPHIALKIRLEIPSPAPYVLVQTVSGITYADSFAGPFPIAGTIETIIYRATDDRQTETGRMWVDVRMSPLPDDSDEVARTVNFKYPSGVRGVNEKERQFLWEWREAGLVRTAPKEVIANIDLIARAMRQRRIRSTLEDIPQEQAQILSSDADDAFTQAGLVHQSNFAHPASRLEPYCGLYCLYAVARLFGEDVSLDQLLDPSFLSSEGGSSFQDMLEAAALMSLVAVPIKNVSVSALANSVAPAILHVSSSTADEPSHFILFLGMDDGHMLLYDPPGPVRRVPQSMLRRIWRGSGILLGRHDSIAGPIVRAGWVDWAWRAGIAIAVVVLFIVMQSATARTGRSHDRWRIVLADARLAMVLLLCVSIASLAINYFNSSGLIAAHSLIEVTRAQHTSRPAELDLQSMVQMASQGGILVDARHEGDYERAHAPGSISIPANAGVVERKKRLGNPRNGVPIIVYCVNAECTYADRVAENLAGDGLQPIYIYRGGWEAYVAARLPIERSARIALD